MAVITDPQQITIPWLTRKLRERGLIGSSSIVGLNYVKQDRTFASINARWTVDYSDGAPVSAPRQLFLKSVNPALAPGDYDPASLSKEIFYYQSIAPSMESAPSPLCIDVEINPATGASHILLEDVAETHFGAFEPVNDTICEQAVECLARLHAYWWDHPRLGKDIGVLPSDAGWEKGWPDSENGTKEFLRAHADNIPSQWAEIYERVYRSMPGLCQRHFSNRHLTLAHGDAHLGNFLFARDLNHHPAYLIDWQFWYPTIGGTDLAFLIATEWEPEVRRRFETPLLQRYYSCLLECGVKDYSWETCWNDYRLSVILISIFIPIWQWSLFKWEANLKALQRSMSAFQELECAELFHGR